MTAAILTLALLGAGVGSTGAPESRSGHQDIPAASGAMTSGTPAARFGMPELEAHRGLSAALRPAGVAAAGVLRRPATVAPPVRNRPVVGSTPTGGSIHGTATWYGTGGPGLYAAMDGYVDGTRVFVTVTAANGARLTLRVVTQCAACRNRDGAVVVDLSAEAFVKLGYPLSAGVAPVSVSVQ